MSLELERRLRDARAALPMPSARATNEAREAVIGSTLRRRRGRLQTTAAVVVLVGATVCGIVAGLLVAPSGGASSPLTVTGLGFLPAKGWSVVQSGPGAAQHSIAVATNGPVSPLDVPLDGPPYTTIRRLPLDGIVLYAEFTARGNVWTDLGYPAEAGVPRLEEAYRETAWNDQIRPENPLGQYVLHFSSSGYNVDVHAYIGRLRATDAQLAAAQEQLDRMIVAGEPITLQATPTIATWGQSIRLIGSVTSGRADEPVSVEERHCGSPTRAWTSVAETHTEAGGGWHMPWGALITHSVRAVWKGQTSNVVIVRARPSVVVRQVMRTRFLVGVRALKRFEGRTIVLERFDRGRGRFVTVKRARLADSVGAGMSFLSSAAVRSSLSRGTLVRAVFPRTQAGPCYLAGYSNQLRLTR
jgi:hypothetical protein